MCDVRTYITDSYQNDRDKHIRKMANTLKYNKHLAEDIVQESYEKALKYENTYRPELGSFNTWFNSILYSTLRLYQKQNIKVDINVEHLEGEIPRPEYNRVFVDRILSVNNEKHRRVLIAYFILGYNSSQVGRIYDDITSTNVTTICKRFLDGMKE